MATLHRAASILVLLAASCAVQEPAGQEPGGGTDAHPSALRGDTLLTFGFSALDLGSDGEASLQGGGKTKPDVDPGGFEFAGHFFFDDEDSWGLRLRNRDYDVDASGRPFLSAVMVELLYRRWFFQGPAWDWEAEWAWFLEGFLGLGVGETDNRAFEVDSSGIAGTFGLFAGGALIYDGFLAEARAGYSATGVSAPFSSDELAARGFELALAVGLSF